MIRHMRHGSPPRLKAFQSIPSPNRRESLPTPSAGVRMTCAILVAVGSKPGGERMPVPTLYPERVLLKLRAGTCANISTVLKPGLTRADFIRLAIDEKIAQL